MIPFFYGFRLGNGFSGIGAFCFGVQSGLDRVLGGGISKDIGWGIEFGKDFK